MGNCIQKLDIREFSGSKDLFTREQGQRVSEEIRSELEKVSSGGILLLDFSKIRSATPSCLVEILSIFGQPEHPELRDKYPVLKLESTNRDLRYSILLTLKEKNSVILSFDEQGNWMVLGKLTKAQKDTFEIVAGREETTSTEISRLMDIPINAASNRLRDLYDMKLIAREEKILPVKGGRQFVYRVVICP